MRTLTKLLIFALTMLAGNAVAQQRLSVFDSITNPATTTMLPILFRSGSNYVNKTLSLYQLRAYFSDGSGSPVSIVTASVTPTSVYSMSVTNPASTPHISLSMRSAGAYELLGNNTGSSAVPAYFAPTLASALFRNQGTTAQVLHGNASGNPSWSSVSLTNDVSGVLAADKGGTGQSSYTLGDLLYASGTTALSKLNIGTSGQQLRVSSGGIPEWFTGTTGTVTTVTVSVAPASIYSATVTNPTTTPGISITMIPIAAKSIIGNSTGSSASPVAFVPATQSLDDNSSSIATTAYVQKYIPLDTSIAASYTLTSRDAYRTIHSTAGSGITLTVPTGLGTRFNATVVQEGAGQVTISASGTTLTYIPTATTKTKQAGSIAFIRSWATSNSFTVQGDLL